jgi:hypothetical protein
MNHLCRARELDARAAAELDAGHADALRTHADYHRRAAAGRRRAYVERPGWHFYCHDCRRRMTASDAVLPRSKTLWTPPATAEPITAYCERCARRRRLKVWTTALPTADLHKYPYFK